MTAAPQSRAHTGVVIFSAGFRPFSDLGRRSDPALAWHQGSLDFVIGGGQLPTAAPLVEAARNLARGTMIRPRVDRRTAPFFGRYLSVLAAQFLHACPDHREVVGRVDDGAARECPAVSKPAVDKASAACRDY
jgi:hypothetical protein